MAKPLGGKVGNNGIPHYRQCTCHIDLNGPVGCYHDDEIEAQMEKELTAIVDPYEAFVEPTLDGDQRDYFLTPARLNEQWDKPQPWAKARENEEDRLRNLLERVLDLAESDGSLDYAWQSPLAREIEELINAEL